MSGQAIRQEGDLRRWRTEIPNLYDDAGLDPYAFRLLVHYARVGNCFESVRTTAEKCGMSVGQVVDKRDELAAAGWIRIADAAEARTYRITVVDVWEENFRTYSAISKIRALVR